MKEVENIEITKINFISINTKVKRLGYLKLLSDFFIIHKEIPIKFLNKKFEEYCINFKPFLENKINRKGEIISTKTGNSAKPYIKFASDFGFIVKTNNNYIQSKLFKIYEILKKTEINENPFILTNFDKLFLLENILKTDFINIFTILESIYLKDKTSLNELKLIFENQLINNLLKFNILQQKKQNFETQLIPRLNWLYDLNLIDLDIKNNVIINLNGKKLFEKLCISDVLNIKYNIDFENYINSSIINIYDDIYDFNKQNNLAELEINELIENYINESFTSFQTLASNRVNAFQAIQYTKYKMYFNNNFKIEFTEIETLLEKNIFPKFIYKYQQQFNDGYIQIKNI